MKSRIILAAAVAVLSVAHVAGATTLNVPGTSHTWLAGMPDGTVGVGGDVAPTHSPVQVTGVPFTAGDILTFSATGMVRHGPGQTFEDPDGSGAFSYTGGNANGMSSITAPVNALLGVFLSDVQPDSNPAPAILDFSTIVSQEMLAYSPELQQVFFIGDGEIPAGTQQEFTVPTGATRLFLGTHDGFGWFNNEGSFDVTIKNLSATPPAIPLPAGGALLLTGIGLLALRRKA